MRQRLISFLSSRPVIIFTGGLIGLMAALLEKLGNPPGTGLCIVCFERDLVGALGLHQTAGGQCFRAEVIGLVLGSTIAALAFREFKARGGSSPLIRFFLGAFAMIGALFFMGCPMGIILRLAGGNLNAVLALSGLMVGIWIGVGFMKAGFDLGGKHPSPPVNAWLMPVFMFALLLIFVFDLRVDNAGAPFRSWIEPSSLRAPVNVALIVGMLIGFLAQRTRFCMIGAFRDVLLMGYGEFLWGIGAMVVMAWAGNLVTGQIRLRFLQLGAEAVVGFDQYLWSFLGAVLAGLAFTLAGGCAGRQLFLSGEGDGDATIFVFGMFGGAAMAHNFRLIARPACGTVGGIETLGGVVILVGLLFCLTIGLAMRRRWEVN